MRRVWPPCAGTAVLALLLLMPALAGARGYEGKKTVEGFEIILRLDRHPPTLGENPVAIEIRDKSGKVVADGRVQVNYYMPPMPRMVPMNYTTDAKLKGERYKAIMNVIMTGPWIVAVKITHGGKTSTAKFTVDAQ